MTMPYPQRVRITIGIYCNLVPYMVILAALARHYAFIILNLKESPDLRNGILFDFLSLNPNGPPLSTFHIPVILYGLALGLGILLVVSIGSSLKRRFHRLIVGSICGPLLGTAFGFYYEIVPGYFIGVVFGIIYGVVSTEAFGISVGLSFSTTTGLTIACTGGMPYGLEVAIAFGLGVGLMFGLTANIATTLSQSKMTGIAYSFGFVATVTALFTIVTKLTIHTSYLATSDILTAFQCWLIVSSALFFRLYYLPYHFLALWPASGLSEIYKFHPAAWDEGCLIPFPGLDRILISYADHDRRGAEKEVDHLIEYSPAQRNAAVRAKAILVIRRTLQVKELTQITDFLAELPEGPSPFLRAASELKRKTRSIVEAQTAFDLVGRKFLEEPFARLVVVSVESFKGQIIGYHPLLVDAFRQAALKWLEIARHQQHNAQRHASSPLIHQVFCAGDPVDRDREAFVIRAALLNELERQILLSTGCSSLLIYGRRRMGKSTFLKNLDGMLAQRVSIANISMQQARAFLSLEDFIGLLSSRIISTCELELNPVDNLRSLEIFLSELQDRLSKTDRRLLLGIDEYENLDRKIGEGVLPEDLLAVIRESIQNHRRITWAFAGSLAIEELKNAPWPSFLVSTRMLEVTPFEFEETYQLLTEPLKTSSYWNSDSARHPPRFSQDFWGADGIESIHRVTGGWPHLVQLVAENSVDVANDLGASSMDEQILETAFDRSVERGNITFMLLLETECSFPGEWDYLRSFKFDEVQKRPTDELVARSLKRRRLVREEDTGLWTLRVPLMRRWIQSL